MGTFIWLEDSNSAVIHRMVLSNRLHAEVPTTWTPL